MKAELYTGKLIGVEDNKLIFQEDFGNKEFLTEGLNIDREWINTHIGLHIQCVVIDGVITELRSS